MTSCKAQFAAVTIAVFTLLLAAHSLQWDEGFVAGVVTTLALSQLLVSLRSE